MYKQNSRLNEARKALAKGIEISEKELPALDKSVADWQDWLVAQTFRRESEARLGADGVKKA